MPTATLISWSRRIIYGDRFVRRRLGLDAPVALGRQLVWVLRRIDWRSVATTSSGARRQHRLGRQQHRLGQRRQHRLGQRSDDNIVWGNESDNIVWGRDNIVWGKDNIVWGNSDDDNIVWGNSLRRRRATNVWGGRRTARGRWTTRLGHDNIVWGNTAATTSSGAHGRQHRLGQSRRRRQHRVGQPPADDNIVWGKALTTSCGATAGDNIVWGNARRHRVGPRRRQHRLGQCGLTRRETL